MDAVQELGIDIPGLVHTALRLCLAGRLLGRLLLGLRSAHFGGFVGWGPHKEPDLLPRPLPCAPNRAD